MILFKKELLVAGILLILAWFSNPPHLINMINGVLFFYFLFRYLLLLLIDNDISCIDKKYLINRFNIFLIIHGFIFLMLVGYYLEFDFFIESLIPALGQDSQAYNIMGEEYARSLIKGEHVSFENPKHIERMMRAGSYVTLVGLIYYFFDFSLTLAIGINIFFVISYSIILYILLNNIFNSSVAKIGMYFSAFIPSIFLNELGLFKDIFVTFSFIILSLFAYKFVNKKQKTDLFMLVLFMVILFYLRFYYLIPIILYFGYIYLFKKISIKRTLVTILMLTAIVILLPKIISIGLGGNVLQHLYYQGYDMDIYSSGSHITLKLNKINLANPLLLFTTILNNSKYFFTTILKIVLVPWIYPRIYYIPWLSYPASDPMWVFHLFNYITTIIKWMLIFIGFNGFFKLFKNKDSEIIWISLLFIPLLVDLFILGTGSRYLGALLPYVFACYAIGFKDKKTVKLFFILSIILSFALIMFINKNTIPISSSILIISSYALFYIFNNAYTNFSKLQRYLYKNVLHIR